VNKVKQFWLKKVRQEKFQLMRDNLKQSCYPMSSRLCGMCLMVGIISFRHLQLHHWGGALNDHQRLLALFQNLEFDMYVGQDLTVDDRRLTTREFTVGDHRKFDPNPNTATILCKCPAPTLTTILLKRNNGENGMLT